MDFESGLQVMKKIILLFIGLMLTVVGCTNNNDNWETESLTRNNLNIVSEYNEYIIALSEEQAETNVYSMYKNTEYENYQKIWSFDVSDNHDIENHHITWNDNIVYLLGYSNSGYNIKDGKQVYSPESNLMILKDNNGTGRLDNVLGNDGKYIYYEYSCNADYYYGKVSMDLTTVEVIEKNDIPSNLN